MLFAEFALEPSLLTCDLTRIADLASRFGFHTGALISKLPKSVFGEFKGRALSDLGNGQTFESKQVELLIEKLASAFVKFERPDPGRDWLKDICSQHIDRPFYRIAVEQCRDDLPSECLELWQLNDALADVGFSRDTETSALAMASAVKPLLKNSRQIWLIDPYFYIGPKPGNPGSRYRGYEGILKAIISYASEGGRRVAFQIHKEDRSNYNEASIQEQEEYLKSFISREFTRLNIEFYWWNDNNTRLLHPRYLVTELGGVNFDKGFSPTICFRPAKNTKPFIYYS